MTDLAELVGPCGVEEFLDTVWGRRMEIFRGDRDRFAHLLPWSALNELLRRHRLESPRLRLAKDGAPVAIEEYTTPVTPRRGPSYRRLDQASLATSIRDGATLVLDSIDELYPQIDDLAADLEHTLRERVQVNCYASFSATKGFATHWDDHDVLAIQVHGRKHWRVFGPTRPYPTRRDVVQPEPPEGEPAHDFVLEAGDVLHVPRGWWHDASALDGPSLHLTFGITSANGVDFAAWAADELRRFEVGRQDLPRFADPGTKAARVKEIAELLASRLAEPDALDRFFADRDATAPPRAWGGLPFAVAEPLPESGGLTVRFLVPRAVLEERDRVVELSADGKRYTFAGAAAPVLRELVTCRPRTVDELVAASGGLSAATIRTLCTDLLRRGLLTAS